MKITISVIIYNLTVTHGKRIYTYCYFCPIFVYYYAIKCRNIVVTLQTKTNPTYREYKIKLTI